MFTHSSASGHLYYFYFKKKNLSFGCTGSLLLCTGFLSLGRAGTTLRCGVWDSCCAGLSYCGAQAVGAWLSCPMACEIFCTRDWTGIPCRYLNTRSSGKFCFYFLTGEYCCLSTFMYRVLLGHKFPFWFISSSQFAGSYSNFVVNLLRNCQTVFQSGCIL